MYKILNGAAFIRVSLSLIPVVTVSRTHQISVWHRQLYVIAMIKVITCLIGLCNRSLNVLISLKK